MRRNTNIALALGLCLAVLGAPIEARADCQQVRGGITETRIPSNDSLGRFLGNVTGVLNGASTVFINMPNPVDASAPWGGFKASGWGRESSMSACPRRPSSDP